MSYISYSQIRMFNTCHRKYYLSYRKKLKSIYKHTALFYGSALDQAINSLLLKDGQDPTKVFEKSFTFADLNQKGKPEFLPDNIRVVYAEKDFDQKLLTVEDKTKIENKAKELQITIDTIGNFVSKFLETKSSYGVSQLQESKIKLYNFIQWTCSFRKGLITLESYKKEILPLIKNVIAVQDKIEVINKEGDKLLGFVDIILEMQDGKRVLFDNKTSAREYARDSAEHSSQLTLYYNCLKEKYNLTHVGYIVMLKQLKFNTKKTCKECKHKITSRVKTCDNELSGLRCGGELNEVSDPECPIQVIISEVSPFTQELVNQEFDLANKAIKSENWAPNLSSCVSYSGLTCEYVKYCHSGSKKDLEETD